MSPAVQTRIDSRAIEIATAALTRIERHEVDCAERYRGQRALLLTIAAKVFLLLVVTVGYLADRLIVGSAP